MILNDKQIKKLSEEEEMITPFVSESIISPTTGSLALDFFSTGMFISNPCLNNSNSVLKKQ